MMTIAAIRQAATDACKAAEEVSTTLKADAAKGRIYPRMEEVATLAEHLDKIAVAVFGLAQREFPSIGRYEWTPVPDENKDKP